MNGPQHYTEAERLLGSASEMRKFVGDSAESGSIMTMATVAVMGDVVTSILSQAQVHATLALTAATAYAAIEDYLGDEATDGREWAKAVSR